MSKQLEKIKQLIEKREKARLGRGSAGNVYGCAQAWRRRINKTKKGGNGI